MKTMYLSIIAVTLTIFMFLTASNPVQGENSANQTKDILDMHPQQPLKAPSWVFTTEGVPGTIAMTPTANKIVIGTQSKGDEGTVYLLDSKGSAIWSSKQQKMISSVGITDDGSRIVAGGDEMCKCPAGIITGPGMVYYFDSMGNMLWNYKTYGGVTGVSISPNGTWIAVGTENQVLLLDSQGTLRWSQNVTRTNMHSVVAFPDGSVITKDDNLFEFFNKNGTISWTYNTGETAGRAVVFSTDYKKIAIADEQYGVSVFDTDGHRLWNDYVPNMVNSISIASDGSIAIGSQQWGPNIPESFYLFDGNGKLLWKYIGATLTGVSDDGQNVVVGNWGNTPSLLLLNRNGNLVWKYNADNVWSLKMSHDGSSVIAGTALESNMWGPGKVLFFANGKTVPEFPFTIPVLLLGIMSIIVFYRMRFGKQKTR